MAIFLVVPTVPKAEIKPELKAKVGAYPHYSLPNGEYLVSFSGTSRELSDALEVTEGKNGTAVIVSVGSYYGRATNDVWEWMSAHWGQS